MIRLDEAVQIARERDADEDDIRYEFATAALRVWDSDTLLRVKKRVLDQGYMDQKEMSIFT